MTTIHIIHKLQLFIYIYYEVQFSKYISRSYKVHNINTILHTIITPGPLELTFDPGFGVIFSQIKFAYTLSLTWRRNKLLKQKQSD